MPNGNRIFESNKVYIATRPDLLQQAQEILIVCENDEMLYENINELHDTLFDLLDSIKEKDNGTKNTN